MAHDGPFVASVRSPAWAGDRARAVTVPACRVSRRDDAPGVEVFSDFICQHNVALEQIDAVCWGMCTWLAVSIGFQATESIK